MSRMIGRAWVEDKEFRINQAQHAQPDGEYEIQDKEKRAEFEAARAKAKFLKK